MSDYGDEPMPTASEGDFAEGDVVLAFHGNLLYEARVLDLHRERSRTSPSNAEPAADEDEDDLMGRVTSYTVRYQGWKKSWEETVSRDLVFEHNDENLRVAHRLLNGAKMRHQASHPASTSHDMDKVVAKVSNASYSVNSMFQLPPSLQRVLVDDWENVTKEMKLVPLPRAITVDGVLQRWVSNRRQTVDKATKEVAEALLIYFNASLSKILLYRFERQQYEKFFHSAQNDGGNDGTANRPPPPTEVYGAEHLLRLLLKLPFIMETGKIPKDKIRIIADKVNDLYKYLVKNSRVLFLLEYEPAPPTYVENYRQSF